MRWTTLLKCIAFFDKIIETATHLLVTPQDVVVDPGGKASFNCSTNLDEGIRWMYATETNSEMQDHIYSGGFTYRQWRKRHNVTASSAGFFTLTIEPIVPTDAGFYSCMDIKDDDYHEAKLTLTPIGEWVTTDSWSELHTTSEHSMINERSIELVILGIVSLVLLITIMAAICQRKFFKSGKLFRAETPIQNHKVIISDVPSHIKNLLAVYFNHTRKRIGEIEAPLAKEKCTAENVEEMDYMITK